MTSVQRFRALMSGLSVSTQWLRQTHPPITIRGQRHGRCCTCISIQYSKDADRRRAVNLIDTRTLRTHQSAPPHSLRTCSNTLACALGSDHYLASGRSDATFPMSNSCCHTLYLGSDRCRSCQSRLGLARSNQLLDLRCPPATSLEP